MSFILFLDTPVVCYLLQIPIPNFLLGPPFSSIHLDFSNLTFPPLLPLQWRRNCGIREFNIQLLSLLKTFYKGLNLNIQFGPEKCGIGRRHKSTSSVYLILLKANSFTGNL